MQNIETIIADFAKANKISRVKLKSFAETIQQVIQPVKANKPSGRPVLDKTKALHHSILQAINNGYKGQRNAVLVRKLVQVDYPQIQPADFQNALNALIHQGRIIRVGKASTGKQGRQPYILEVFPEPPEQVCYVL